MTPLELSDSDTNMLLEEMGIDPEDAGAANAESRRKLLHQALKKVQAVGRVLKKTEGGPGLLDPQQLPELRNLAPLAKCFDADAMYSFQEKLSIEATQGQISTAWFELRRTFGNFIDTFVTNKGTTRRLHLATYDGQMGGVVEVMGCRLAGDVPLLEIRCQFYELPVSKEYADAELRTNLPGMQRNLLIEIDHDEMKLIAAMFQTNTASLSSEYIEAQQASWGSIGKLFSPSFLLPIQPLTADVRLPKTCQVCGKEGARKCAGCQTISYCSKECQKQDWKRHKPECQSSSSSSSSTPTSSTNNSSSNSNTVVVKLDSPPIAPFGSVIPTNVSSSQMRRVAGKGPQWSDGQAPEVRRQPDAAKKFVVKIQAPLGGLGTALLLYDEKRKIMTHLSRTTQPERTYDKLLAVIRQHGVMGAKLYFWAVMESPNELVVALDKLPGQMHRW